ncbi:acyl-CoA dehydrogenase [Apiospora arundinis]|uniref:Acyl-CoA dehydrogenase n=1 Tax=Apiospora arundinis TaxID=335852 RepID=A0ABR2J3Y8_9PEZI
MAALVSQPSRFGAARGMSKDDVSVEKDDMSSAAEETILRFSLQSTGDNTKNLCDKETAERTEVGEPVETLPKEYTAQDVTKHKSETDLWIIVGSDIYDVTDFQHQHPGGSKVMRGVAGKDATKKFDKHHRRGILEPYKSKYQVGVLVGTLSSTEGEGDHGGVTVGSQKRRGGLFGKLWR